MRLKLILILLPVILFSQEGKTDFEKGLELYFSKKFLMAVGSFRKAIERGFQNEKVYFYLGNSYAFIENYDRAIESLKMASELSENQKFKSLAIHNLAYVYYLKKDYKKCINHLNIAYSLNTNLNQVFWYKGMAFYKLRDKNNTIIEWERYLELAPDGEESDNIRRALAILKSKDFSFEKDGDKIIVSDGMSGGKDKKIDVLPLIDIEGVLEEIKLEDKGKVADEELEEIEK